MHDMRKNGLPYERASVSMIVRLFGWSLATNDSEPHVLLRPFSSAVKHGFRWWFVAHVSTTEIRKWRAYFDAGAPDAAIAREIYPAAGCFSIRVRLFRGDLFYAGHARSRRVDRRPNRACGHR